MKIFLSPTVSKNQYLHFSFLSFLILDVGVALFRGFALWPEIFEKPLCS